MISGVINLSLLLGPIIFRICLDIIYSKYIINKWAYMGFGYEINNISLSVSYTLLIVLSFLLWLGYNKRKLSNNVIVILFYTIYIPMGTIYSLYKSNNSVPFILTNISFIAIILFITYLDKIILKKKYVKKSNEKLRKRIYKKSYFIQQIIKVISIYTFLAMTTQNISNIDISILFNLKNVYGVRQAASYGLGMAYLFEWQSKVINPFMIIKSHYDGNKYMMRIYVLFQLWLFILTGHKSVLFSIPVILIIKILSDKKYLDKIIKISLPLLSIISLIEMLLRENSFLIDYLMRRVFLIPALLNNYYYEYFTQYGFQYWSNSIIGRIFGSNGEIPPAKRIGEYFFGNSNMNAVTGYIGAEYANAGFLGVMMATCIIILILVYIDKCVKINNKNVVLCTMIFPIYTLWNSAILTSLLTGGILLGIVILLNYDITIMKE